MILDIALWFWSWVFVVIIRPPRTWWGGTIQVITAPILFLVFLIPPDHPLYLFFGCQMNKAQKAIICVALLALLLTGLFPPWQFSLRLLGPRSSMWQETQRGPWSNPLATPPTWLLHPPATPTSAEMAIVLSGASSTQVDRGTLFLSWFGISVGTVALFVLLRGPSSNAHSQHHYVAAEDEQHLTRNN